jgi:hypothetical protein
LDTVFIDADAMRLQKNYFRRSVNVHAQDVLVGWRDRFDKPPDSAPSNMDDAAARFSRSSR